MIVVSPTFYPNVLDARCQLGLAACRAAKAIGVQVLLVDASPPEVRAALEQAGATVRPQTRAGRKGAALREAIEAAAALLPPDGVILFWELEKVRTARPRHATPRRAASRRAASRRANSARPRPRWR